MNNYNLIANPEKWGRATTISELMPIYTRVQTLLDRGEYITVNKLLKIDTTGLSPVMLLGLARLTSMHREMIDVWEDYLLNVRRELDSRGFNGAEMLCGLGDYDE